MSIATRRASAASCATSRSSLKLRQCAKSTNLTGVDLVVEGPFSVPKLVVEGPFSVPNLDVDGPFSVPNLDVDGPFSVPNLDVDGPYVFTNADCVVGREREDGGGG